MEPSEAFESPGKYLKAMRESQGLSLNEVANATRIREPVLVALEEDRYANLPSLYVKSFLGAYAQCLGLDPGEIAIVHQKYVEKLSPSKDRQIKHPPAVRRKRSKTGVLVISIFVVLLMAVTAYGLFTLLR